MQPTRATRQPTNIPTYPLPDPDRHPMFFEKRVYQGSSGRVYPLAFHSKISDDKVDHPWDLWTLDNGLVKIELMPELGGRIWRGLDLTNNYDFFYRQPVVKPALVGLAGPWISGGVEFNWPQHHRPATYLPADATLEEHDDGARTVWMSDHDPMAHLKGMHGVTVRPGSTAVELSVRLYNRTPFKHTFLWWANVAAEVHDQYQSFFPPDVRYVADHAVRAMSSFPIAKNHYYGVDYRPGTDLSWYKNIPVPTSYMITKTDYDFFGGYDFAADGGFVHIADRFTCPGKKQWTWGNHDFGWAWDRELTDANERGEYPPYVELMAGAYTDNQPDFSYLLPYETKTFTQVWWPIRGIGVAHNASKDFALHLSVDDGKARLGVCASSAQPDARLRLTAAGQVLHDEPAAVSPDKPVVSRVALPGGCKPEQLTLEVVVHGKAELAYTPPKADDDVEIPPSATEPPAPADIAGNDELYLTGEHLEQYRHPTREPERYWEEAVARDAGDMRANTALGRRLLQRGLIEQAEQHLRTAVQRSRIRHPNPEDGEPLYFLGLALKRLGRTDEAYQWLYKSTWNYAWRAPGRYQLATIDAARGDFDKALDHLAMAQQTNAMHSHAKVLQAALSRKLERHDAALATLDAVLAEDKLDHWAGFERVLVLEQQGGAEAGRARAAWREATGLRTPTLLDLAYDYAEAGLVDEALDVLGQAGDSAPPIVHYTRAWLLGQQDETDAAARARADAKQSDASWCFPDRLEEEVVLRAALAADAGDALAGWMLGNLLYDKRRYDEAVNAWEQARDADDTMDGVQRNLGIAYFNTQRDPQRARAAYARAVELNPDDAQVLFESDLLLKITGEAPADRIARLEARPGLVKERDDLSIEYVALLNLVGRHADAAASLAGRRFHPWEGGEGKVLEQHTLTHLALGRAALEAGDADQARGCFEHALSAPENLGEARHLLANNAEIQYHLGLAHRALGDDAAAQRCFQEAAENAGDFLEMAVQPYSEKSYYKGLGLRALSRDAKADEVFTGMAEYGKTLCASVAKIDYFATSLPDLLVFEVDRQRKQETDGLLMQALAALGLDQADDARRLLTQVLERDPSHQTARSISATLAPSAAG